MTAPTDPTPEATAATTVTTEPAPPPPVHWRKLHAFGLPGGSVRALLAVAVFAGIWVGLWLHPEDRVPDYLQNLMFIIMGHYFAARAKKETGPDPGPPPLFLPRGSIRFILVAGFIAVAAALFYQGRVWIGGTPGAGPPRVAPGAVTLVLVGGFLLGVVFNKLAQWLTERRRPPRIVEDLRAAVTLLAAALLLLLTFRVWSPPDPAVALGGLEQLPPEARVENLLAAVVGFYFGSRS